VLWKKLKGAAAAANMLMNYHHPFVYNTGSFVYNTVSRPFVYNTGPRRVIDHLDTPCYKKLVPLSVKGRLFPAFPVQIVQYTEGYSWSIDVDDAHHAMVHGTEFLRRIGVLLPRERIQCPVAYETHIVYEVTKDPEDPRRQRVLDEIPAGRQRIVEKRALTKIGLPLPEELVDFLHDFVWPVDRRRKGSMAKEDIGQ
jgi:hypothetical protein